jgi:hypothetical protein
MSPFSHHCETVAAGRVTRYTLNEGPQALSYRRALDLLAGDAGFRGYLSRLLADASFTSFRWETPPITHATIDRPFEFVLVNDPFIDMAPEPEVFGEHFGGPTRQHLVVAVPNLGRTATLVVPRQLDEQCAYPHLAAFARTAPEAQMHALWQCAANEAQARLSDNRLWISTAGGGVAWLHVRLEGTPKYYAHRPYANAA